MPALEVSIIKSILNKDNTSYPVFIETGTATGDTTFAMVDLFKVIHTIEISEYSYNNTKSKYNGEKINFYLGDSSNILGNILPNINDNIIFFLDGHYSAGGTGFGKKHVPLYEELELINRLHKHKSIIIIDDYRLFNTLDGGVCDWTYINKENVLSIVKDRITNVYHLPSALHPEDRLIIELKNI